MEFPYSHTQKVGWTLRLIISHMYQESMAIDYLHNEAFWGEHCGVPGLWDPRGLWLWLGFGFGWRTLCLVKLYLVCTSCRCQGRELKSFLACCPIEALFNILEPVWWRLGINSHCIWGSQGFYILYYTDLAFNTCLKPCLPPMSVLGKSVLASCLFLKALVFP